MLIRIHAHSHFVSLLFACVCVYIVATCWNSNPLAETSNRIAHDFNIHISYNKTNVNFAQLHAPTSIILPQNTRTINIFLLNNQKKAHAVFAKAISKLLTHYKTNTDFMHNSLTKLSRLYDCPGHQQ